MLRYCCKKFEPFRCIYRQEIRTATSSMTSVPKPLKFLRPHYGTLKEYFERMPESDLKVWIIIFFIAVRCSRQLCANCFGGFTNFAEVPSRYTICVGPDNVCRRGKGMLICLSFTSCRFFIFVN